MRQVPHYAIIGNGRMATHICHYFEQLNLAFSTWSRAHNNEQALPPLLSQSTHALILLSDDVIDEFIEQHILSSHPHLLRVHFSGSLISRNAYSAHPLQTFSNKLYTLSDYQKIPFTVDDNAPSFGNLLPGLDNPHYRITHKNKAYYHALCVLANNFSSLIWGKFFQEMQQKYGFESKHLLPFLKQTFANIEANPKESLTGPIQRNDTATLKRDLNALKNDEFYTIFKAFINQFTGEEYDYN